MALSNSQYDSIMRIYNQKQLNNKHELDRRTKEVYENSIPMEYYEKTITDEKKCIKNIYLGQYQFDFPSKQKQNHTNVVTERRSLKIGTSFYLPIGITIQTTEKYQPKKKILTKKKSTVEIKKTARTLSYEESQKRGKDCSL